MIHDIKLETGSILLSKLDGSMVTPVLFKKGIMFKTKKSFYSDLAKEANVVADKELIEFCTEQLQQRIQPIFEYISASNQVVCDYSPDEYGFTLIALRHLDSGEYLPIHDISDVKVVLHEPLTTIDDLVARCENETGIEGFVLINKDQRIKFKTEWYNLRHRMTHYTERSIGDLVVKGVLDDLYPDLTEKQRVVFSDVELRVSKDILKVYQDHKLLFNIRESYSDKKEFWKKHNNDIMFPYAGYSEINSDSLMKIWKKYLRNNYSNKRVIFM